MTSSDLPLKVTTIADYAAVLGEGPVWVEREDALYWVDVKAPRICRLAGSDLKSWTPPFRISAVAPRLHGGFIAATEHGFAFIDPERNSYQLILNPEENRPRNRFNDGKVDRAGNFWAGTMDAAEEEATGALYRLDTQLNCVRIDAEYRVTNGPAFSLDGEVMYHTDSASRVIYRFTFKADGGVEERTIFRCFTEEEGHPDGMTVDSEDCLWVAFWDGYCVRRFSPGGILLGSVRLPVQRPTSCAFGTPDLQRLFITSARIGLAEAEIAVQPLAGAVLGIDPGITGARQASFAG